MADKNINSEKDNAYIENLLNKLRETLGQASKQDEKKAETQSAEPLSHAASPSVTDEASVSENTANEDAPSEKAGSDVSTVPFAVAEPERAQSLSDVQSEEIPQSSVPVERKPEVPVETLTKEAGEKSPEQLPVAADAEQVTTPPPVLEPQAETERRNADRKAEEATQYAKTVLPKSSRISENTRHPVSERYRDFATTNENTPAQDATEMMQGASSEASATPTIKNLPDAPESSGAETVDGRGTAPTQDALPPEGPVPDAVQPMYITLDSPIGGLEMPASVWDTVPPSSSPKRETSDSPLSNPADAQPDSIGLSGEEEQSETGAKKAKKRAHRDPTSRKTFADCSFVMSDRRAGVVTDAILKEPPEFTDDEQPKEQLERWRQELRYRSLGAKIRCIAAGVIVLLLMLLELIPSLTQKWMSAMLLTRVPGAALLIDLQLLLLICLICYRPLYRGFAALRFGRVLPETLASFAALFAVLLDIGLYIGRTTLPVLAALTASVAVLCAALADYFRVEVAVRSLRTYAAKGHHFVGTLTDARRHALLGAYFDTDDEIQPLLEAEPASRIDGFMEQCRTRNESRVASLIALCIAAVVALIDLILLLVLRRGVDYALWSAVTVFCGSLPLSAFATHRFLFYTLCARIGKERVAVTGETAVYEYAKTKVMTFDDSEAFPAGAVQVNGIKLCGDFRLDKALYLMASLFDRVGGPLNGVFRVSTSDVTLSDDVILRAIHENGIEAQVNHEDVCVGTREFLERLGVEVFHDGEDEHAEEGKNHVLYVAYRAKLCVKFYVHYEISTTFESNVEYYAKHGVSSVILTADPLLNGKLLDQVSYISEYDIRIVKKTLEMLREDRNIPRTASLITFGPRKTLRRMPFFFASYAKWQKTAVILSIVTTACAGILIPVMMTIWRIQTPLIAFLCQAVALLPTVAIGLSIGRLNPNK
jgi:hypothetical protein